METSAEWPTVSRATRACASWRSSGLSHHVVRGSSGRIKQAATAMTKVATPCVMNNQRHPLSSKVSVYLVLAAYKRAIPDTMDIIEFEDAKGNESGKGRREYVARIEDADTCRNLLPRVKDAQEVERSWVVRRFDYTQEKTHKYNARVIMHDGSEPAYDCPAHHADTHVPRRSDSSDNHITRDL